MPSEAGSKAVALALRTSLDGFKALSPGERHLMAKLLDRVAEGR